MTEHLTLSLREEYTFGKQGLEVSRYSYNVINSKGNNLLRADNLPYHRTDLGIFPLTRRQVLR